MILTIIAITAGLNFSKSECTGFFLSTENLNLGYTNEEQSLVREGEKGFAPMGGVWEPSSRDILIFHPSRKLSGGT